MWGAGLGGGSSVLGEKGCRGESKQEAAAELELCGGVFAEKLIDYNDAVWQARTGWCQ